MSYFKFRRSQRLLIVFCAFAFAGCTDPSCSVNQHLDSSSLVCIPNCASGQAYVNGSCQTCTAGSAPNQDLDQCVQCSAGTFSSTDGSTSCSTCPAGKYSGANATICIACAPGETSNAGSGTCTTCPAGTFADMPASTSCSACTGNTYTSTAGNFMCTACPSGTTANAEGTACN